MNRGTWRLLVGALWLALPAIAVQYWLAWDRLPLRVASHFDASGQPNGWMTREASLGVTLALLAFVLTIATVVLLRVPKPDSLCWALLAMFYMIVGVLYWISAAVLEYNASGRPVNFGQPMLLLVIGVLIVVVVSLVSRRGVRLPSTPCIAEEVHASPAMALLFVVLLGIELTFAAQNPDAAVRVPLVFLCLLFAAVALQAWTGFRYRFSSTGVEISTLGLRLRSIASSQIQDYAVARRNPFQGRGIRGLGNKRAYSWTTTGVQIRTTDGEVFLGHSDPQRLVRDLDAIRQFTHTSH